MKPRRTRMIFAFIHTKTGTLWLDGTTNWEDEQLEWIKRLRAREFADMPSYDPAEYRPKEVQKLFDFMTEADVRRETRAAQIKLIEAGKQGIMLNPMPRNMKLSATIEGKQMSLKEISVLKGIHYETLKKRWHDGIRDERILKARR